MSFQGIFPQARFSSIVILLSLPIFIVAQSKKANEPTLDREGLLQVVSPDGATPQQAREIAKKVVAAWKFDLTVMQWGVLAVSQQLPTNQVPPTQSRVLLAVTAHPDDEVFMGPILTRYAREGVKVYLAIATKGEKGANSFAKIPAGDPLADARRAEATCACKELGAEPPVFFNLNDGELGAMTLPLAKNVHAVADKVQQLIDQLHPDVILTWGPEGGYGHPDHRLVSDAVTQVVQSQHSDIKLYYAGLSPAQAKALNSAWSVWFASMPFHSTDPAYLTVNVSYTSINFEDFERAFECHKSQYTPKMFKAIEKALKESWQGTVSFREWNSTRSAADLFR